MRFERGFLRTESRRLLAFQRRATDSPKNMRVRVAAVIVLGVLVLGLLVFLVGGTVVAVATGEVAVLVNPFEADPGRRIALGPIGPIWAIGTKAPWVDILHVRISTQTVLMAPPEAIAGQFADILTPAIVVLSKDGLNIEVDLNMRYAILPSKTLWLWPLTWASLRRRGGR